MASKDVSEPRKKRCSEERTGQNDKSFTPRSYQIEILEAAMKQNTIACLGTGTGKTFIAVMLIRESSSEVHKPFSEGGKRIFFLVPTVPLVMQQSKTIKDHTDLTVQHYYGDMDVDSWDKDKWTKEFSDNQVLVMTAEIFRIIVDHAFIPVRQIKLLILDECHRAQGDHPYRQIMKCFSHLNSEDIPRIFGLSASLLNGKCKPTKLEENLRTLEKTLRSAIITASDVEDLQRYGTDPDEYVICYHAYEFPNSDFKKKIEDFMGKIRKFKVPDRNRYNDSLYCDLVFFDKPLRLNTLYNTLCSLGPWCAYKAAEIYHKEVSSLLLKPLEEKEKEMLNEASMFLSYFIEKCKTFDFEQNRFIDLVPKLQRLLEIFLAARVSKKFLPEGPISTNLTIHDDPQNYVQMLKQIEAVNSHSDLEICSIIFVKQRITAYVLCQWLLEIKRKKPEFHFLNPDYIVGHGSSGLNVTSMSEKHQRKVLKDFRNKKCNVLVATCVLEEGMDIRQCNLVIRFDLPLDFRAYVQSKGRARAKNSLYILQVEESRDNARFLNDLVNFRTIEKMLLSNCHNRNMPSEEEIQDYMADNLIPPYMPYGPAGPRITMTSAISLINRYCSCLPSDMATKLVPQWEIRLVDPDVSEKKYECVLRMPINSPLRKSVTGEFMKQKKLAKMSAALKACQLLDEIGELNEHLVPVSCLVDKAIEEELEDIEEEEVEGGAQPGTNRRRQVYVKRVPIFLQDAKPVSKKPCYLHIIEMDLVFPLPKELNPRKRPLTNPSDSPRGLGLLTTKKLPPVNPFPVFTKSGKLMVCVRTLEVPFSLSDADIMKIENFHKFIFSDVLCLEKNKTFAPETAELSCYIIPINKGKNSQFEIDWEFMKFTYQHPYKTQKLKSMIKNHKTPFCEELFKEAVVQCTYKNSEWENGSPTLHHVIRVMHDLSPNSKFESLKYRSFKEYYKLKYDVDIENEYQPLVETITNGRLHLWKPLYKSVKETFEEMDAKSKSKQKRMNYRVYLVPELCIVHPFPSPFLFKVMCLPTILFRLRCLLLAEELRQLIAGEGLVGTVQLKSHFAWLPFNLESSDKDLRDYLYKKGELKKEAFAYNVVPQDIIKSNSGVITSFEAKVPLSDNHGPSPSLILQALTSKAAGDEYNLERLEMIGDSFLKYVMSVKTYMKYPQFDEGRLTKVRSVLIQNRQLYQRAKKKNLAEYLTCTWFDCKTTFLPPCYDIEEVIDPNAVIRKSKSEKTDAGKAPDYLYFKKQIISDKCIADSVEALIGAYLLSCGQEGALRFMAWVGLNPFAHKNKVCTDDFKNWPPQPKSPIVSDSPDAYHCLRKLTVDLEKFEDIINYKFKNRAFLLQAFTHPSYTYNVVTECYQRLEFLGDAVLDYLITRQLYEDPNDHSPGKLTDLRSALVNNIFFAYLAVSYNYHKYLKNLSPDLFRLLNIYIAALESSEDFKYFKKYGYCLEEVECFELEEVEVPKALGDIFESVAGAIYLDSGMSLDAVWEVYYPMISRAFDHLCQHVPKSPVRELYELYGTNKVCWEIEQREHKTYAELILPSGKKIVGVGPNKKVAKRSAAKRALSELRKSEPMEF